MTGLRVNMCRAGVPTLFDSSDDIIRRVDETKLELIVSSPTLWDISQILLGSVSSKEPSAKKPASPDLSSSSIPLLSSVKRRETSTHLLHLRCALFDSSCRFLKGGEDHTSTVLGGINGHKVVPVDSSVGRCFSSLGLRSKWESRF